MKQYLILFFLYIILGPLLSVIGISEFGVYPLKTIILLVAIAVSWKHFKELKTFRFYWFSIPIGILIIVFWVLLDPLQKLVQPGIEFTQYNPSIFPLPMMLALVVFRVIGAVLVAAIIEEVFIRSFMIKLLVGGRDWEKVKIGTFSVFSFLVTVVFFGIAHQRWIAGIVTGIILNLLLYWKKDLHACIQAHAVANFVLAVYVISTQNWGFW